ncbi:MAG: GDP-mannose 4,6-dehydratase, partial [Patescibacteria group bacterium]|nr:GDP-mannose 4,6-dehydratase [Patescibacteria group bacterium]
RIPIKEKDRKLPENPYGQSKLMTEELLAFYDRLYGLKSISLRYFNAAGATLDGKLGENHQPESHLIPNVVKTMLENKEFILFGNDYPTKDGTCIRDYIHVVDLAQAHILALEALMSGHKNNVYNLGTGKGYSNLEIIRMVEKVSNKKLKVKIAPRRSGDANKLVADSTKIQIDLGWRPQYSDLQTIIKTAWQWHKRE